MFGLKTGLYEVDGNTVEYYAGDDFGYDLDADEEIPIEYMLAMGATYIRPLDD